MSGATLFGLSNVINSTGMSKVEKIKYIEENKDELISLLLKAHDNLQKNQYGYSAGKRDGFQEAIDLFEKEGKVVVINNFCGPTG